MNFNTRSVTFNLIAINVIVFIASTLAGEGMYDNFSLHYLFNVHDYAHSLDIPINARFEPWQLISHMFMHANIGHIFSNMFAVFMFGAVLEKVWGGQRFLFFYFATGIGAVALHIAVQLFLVYNATGSFDPTLPKLLEHQEVLATYFSTTVGASGAVFGILVAFGMLFPNTELMMIFFPIPIKAKYFVSLYVIFELVMGMRMSNGDNIAHFAHLGGALFGFIIVKIWNKQRHNFY